MQLNSLKLEFHHMRKIIKSIERADLTHYRCMGGKFYTDLRNSMNYVLSSNIIATDREAWAEAQGIAERLNDIKEKLFMMLNYERRMGEQIEPAFAGTLSVAIRSYVNAFMHEPEPVQKPTPHPQPLTPEIAEESNQQSTKEHSLVEILAKLERIEQLTLMGAKDVLNIEDVAAYTGFTKGYIYRVISRGDLPHYKGGGKCVFFRRDDVNAWLCRNRISSQQEIGATAAAYVVNNPIRKGGRK